MTKPTKADIAAVMAHLGSRTSERKAKSSAANGRLGGRPRKASAAAVRRIPGWRLGWGTFKHRLMEQLGVPAEEFNRWDVPADWQAAYQEASGRKAR